MAAAGLSTSKSAALDRLLLLAVFTVASCGLAYELIAGALASYLMGDSVLRFSSIIGAYLFAMGVGSYASRHVTRQITSTFIHIELFVGLLGGLSTTIIYLAFAHLGSGVQPLIYGTVFLIGTGVGMEIPLVMRVLSTNKPDFSLLVSRVLTFDYLGALAVSLLFPLVLAPWLGLVRTSILFGVLNTVVALVCIREFRSEIDVRGALIRSGLVLTVLGLTFWQAEKLTLNVESTIFGGEVIAATNTPYQRVAIVRHKHDTRLFLNGNLQFSTLDEHRYHEALVHIGLEGMAQPKVLILGGGDGMALREVLKHDTDRIIQVDLDKQLTGLFTRNPQLTALNEHSFSNPRLTLINADAAIWIREHPDKFDFIIADFPDPSNFSLGKLYSQAFYAALRAHLNPNGRMVVQSTSPFYAPNAFWTVAKTLNAAGFNTYPYHVPVPSFGGEWGFVLATTSQWKPPTHISVPTSYLTAQLIPEFFIFPKDMQPTRPLQVNRLDNQELVSVFLEEWGQVD